MTFRDCISLGGPNAKHVPAGRTQGISANTPALFVRQSRTTSYAYCATPRLRGIASAFRHFDFAHFDTAQCSAMQRCAHIDTPHFDTSVQRNTSLRAVRRLSAVKLGPARIFISPRLPLPIRNFAVGYIVPREVFPEQAQGGNEIGYEVGNFVCRFRKNKDRPVPIDVWYTK